MPNKAIVLQSWFHIVHKESLIKPQELRWQNTRVQRCFGHRKICHKSGVDSTDKQGDMSRNARNNKNGKKENIMANLANMAKMTILPESPTWQSTKQ